MRVFPVFLLCLVLLAPMVMGDGIGIIDKTLMDVTHENRQLALVDVYNDHEVIHLFLSIVSLDPGNTITVLIPIRTMPEGIDVSNTSESRFMWHYNLTDVKHLHETEVEGVNKTINSYVASTSLFTSSSLVIPLSGLYLNYLLLRYPFGTGGVAGGGWSINFQSGDSAEIHNFTTFKDIRKIYEQYNLTLPRSVNETLQRYSSFHLIALHMKTRAPIWEDKYAVLNEKCPQTMALVKNYVASHPRVKARIVGYYEMNLPDFDKVESTFEMESGDNNTLWNYFWNVMYSIYGYGEMRGIELNVTLPLYEGKAFYPLGTSPAWNSSGRIGVWFRIEDNSAMEFNIVPSYSLRFYGYRYYVWNFDGELPQFDIEGKSHSPDIPTRMGDERQNFSLWLNRNGDVLGVILGIITAIMLWFLILSIFVYIYVGGEFLRRRRFLELIFGTGLLAVFVSGVVAILLVYKFTRKNIPEEFRERNDRRHWAQLYIVIVALAIPLLLPFVFFGSDIYLTPGATLFAMCFVYSLMGITTAVILALILGGERVVRKFRNR